jgi:sec-independent protein translocase protein TatA
MFPQLGPMEIIVVMGIAVLLFGKRLPEVGRSLGKGIVEFKKGLRGIEDEIDLTSTSSPASRTRRSDELARPASGSEYDESAVPKFEPPTTAPVPQMDYEAQPTQD